MGNYSISLAALAVFAAPVNSQTVSRPASPSEQLSMPSAGTVGQRQKNPPTALATVPSGRTDGRVNNRIQSRVRNRIDHNYDPQANALSPFKVADDQARLRGRP
jgi:hypothetical protein